jgi:hypothetical protein
MKINKLLMAKKICIFFIPTLLITSCIASGLGSGKVFTLECTRGEAAKCLKNFRKEHPEFEIPDSLKKYDRWEQDGYSFLQGQVIYFSQKKIEMYYVSLIKNKLTDTTSTQPSYISVRYFFDFKKMLWERASHLEKSELKRIDKRFEKEVLLKLNTDSCDCEYKGGSLSH